MESARVPSPAAPSGESGPARPGRRDITEHLKQLRLELLERERVVLKMGSAAPPAPDLSGYFKPLKEGFDRIGWTKALDLVERHIPDRYQCAAVLTELGKLCRAQNPAVAYALGRKAHALDARPFRTKWLSFVAFDAGHITEAAGLLATVPKDVSLQESEARKAALIEGSHRMLLKEPVVPRPWPRAYEPIARTLLYVTSSCQPFHLSGYTVRTQALLKASAATGWKVSCVARPGYPWDRPDVLAQPPDAPSSQCDGVDYRFLRGAHMTLMPPDAYITTAATLIEARARELRPAIIQAASNHMTALPAAIAARRLGIPFIYEVRGLWEMTAASGKTDWEETERFQLQSRLEALAARNADAVFTLTRQLAAELQDRGVDSSRIHLLPNGADVDVFDAAPRDRGLLAAAGLDPEVFTIGYAGAIKYYEGIEDLVEALAHLHREGKRAQAIIVGDGDQVERLRSRASALHLGHAVRFVGRQPPQIAHAYLRAADAAAVPRKRLDVGEVVSPLKPFEVMALGLPLIMSNVAALADIAEQSGGAAALFEASNPEALAAVIARLMDDPGLRADLAARGREFVTTRGSWKHTATMMTTVLEEVERRAIARSGPLRSVPKRIVRFLNRVSRGEETEAQRQQLAADMALLSTSELFDAAWYLRQNPDVRVNPFEHYLRHGATEGRDPGPSFSTRRYLDENPEVTSRGVNPLVHFLQSGTLRKGAE